MSTLITEIATSSFLLGKDYRNGRRNNHTARGEPVEPWRRINKTFEDKGHTLRQAQGEREM